MSSREKKVITTASQVKVKRSKEEVLEEYLMALIVQSEKPKNASQKAISILSELMSRERAYHKIMDHMLLHFEKTEHFDSQIFAGGLPTELVPAFDTSALFPLPTFDSEDKLLLEVENAAQKLKIVYIQEKMKKLAEEIKQNENDGKEVDELQKQYSELVSHL